MIRKKIENYKRLNERIVEDQDVLDATRFLNEKPHVEEPYQKRYDSSRNRSRSRDK